MLILVVQKLKLNIFNFKLVNYIDRKINTMNVVYLRVDNSYYLFILFITFRLINFKDAEQLR